jgi:hypothetical protein
MSLAMVAVAGVPVSAAADDVLKTVPEVGRLALVSFALRGSCGLWRVGLTIR